MARISSETIGGDDAAGTLYLDLAPHTVRCDAAMTELRAENAELRADIAGLKDAVRTMAIDLRKLQDKTEHFAIEVADDWHLNE
jgi:hypothetical protein